MCVFVCVCVCVCEAHKCMISPCHALKRMIRASTGQGHQAVSVSCGRKRWGHLVPRRTAVAHLSVAFVHNPCDLDLFPPHLPRPVVCLFSPKNFNALSLAFTVPPQSNQSLFSQLAPLNSKIPASVPEREKKRERRRERERERER